VRRALGRVGREMGASDLDLSTAFALVPRSRPVD